MKPIYTIKQLERLHKKYNKNFEKLLASAGTPAQARYHRIERKLYLKDALMMKNIPMGKLLERISSNPQGSLL